MPFKNPLSALLERLRRFRFPSIQLRNPFPGLLESIRQRQFSRPLVVGGAAILLTAGVALVAIGVLTQLGGDDQDDLTVGEIGSPTPIVTPTPGASPEASPGLVEPIEFVGGERLVIESIGINAPLMTLGVNSNGVPQVPDDGRVVKNTNDAGKVVAWYNFSGRPGEGSNAVFSGHVTWRRQQAVFFKLKDLKVGDTIKIVSADNREYIYEVFANFPVNPDDPNAIIVMAPTTEDIATFITCGGTFVPDPNEPFGGDYTNRIVVQAKLIGTGGG